MADSDKILAVEKLLSTQSPTSPSLSQPLMKPSKMKMGMLIPVLKEPTQDEIKSRLPFSNATTIPHQVMQMSCFMDEKFDKDGSKAMLATC